MTDQDGWFLKQPTWRVPTLRAVIVATLLLLIVFLVLVHSIHPFLAQSDPVNGTVLVVEGWLPDHALEEALGTFRKGEYHLMLTTGDPLLVGYYLSDYRTYAELARAILIDKGLSEDSVIAVPAPPVRVDRTYAAALAVKKWFDGHHGAPDAIDVFSSGPHARRSRMLFQRACGDSVRVGVVATPDDGYDPDHWWESSRGFQMVVVETIGFLYAWICPPGSGE
jgi:uncharacterized SAM-binding protein YcdF (DUF218 family)